MTLNRNKVIKSSKTKENRAIFTLLLLLCKTKSPRLHQRALNLSLLDVFEAFYASFQPVVARRALLRLRRV
jgi:hypothetical protein